MWSLPLYLHGEGEGANGLSRTFQTATPIAKNVYSVSKRKATEKSGGMEQLLKSIGDDGVLIAIDGRDTLKWGLLRRHVEALCVGIDNRPDMQAEGNAAVRKVMFQTKLRKLLKDYVEHAIFAVEARRLGVKVPHAMFEEYRAKARAGYAKMGESGKVLLKLMGEGESFYEHNLTNALYWLEYKNQIVKPMTETDDGEVRKMMDIVHSANAAVVATNLYKKVLVFDILKKVKGGMDFGDAAEKWSDCESSAPRGVMMNGTDDYPERFGEGDLPEGVWNALSGLKEGEMTGVVETPSAWHIVRLLRRNDAPSQEERTVEIAQIMLEKDMLQPELSPAQARQRVQDVKTAAVLKTRFDELVRTVKVESKIPLWESSDPSKRRVKVKRLK